MITIKVNGITISIDEKRAKELLDNSEGDNEALFESLEDDIEYFIIPKLIKKINELN